MTTPTKPKQSIDVTEPIAQLNITDEEADLLCVLAGHSRKSKVGRAFLNCLTRRIGWHAEMLRRAPERSLPPHTIEVLKHIAVEAGTLAFWADPNRMPKEVAAELLDVNVADTYSAVLNIKMAAEEGLRRLSDQAGPGKLKRLQSEARARAMREIEKIHRDLSLDCEEGDGDLREFLDRCAKYLET